MMSSWCGQLPLAAVSPNLYKLSRHKNVTIADMISMEGSWKFEFRRVLSNQEVEEYAALLTIIGDNRPVRDGLLYMRRWKLHNSGVFTIKPLYAKMVDDFGVDSFPYQFIWRPAIPPKINILMWSLRPGKLNTIDVWIYITLARCVELMLSRMIIYFSTVKSPTRCGPISSQIQVLGCALYNKDIGRYVA